MIISCSIDLRIELHHPDSLVLTSKLPPSIFGCCCWGGFIHHYPFSPPPNTHTHIHTARPKPDRLCCRNVPVVLFWPTLSAFMCSVLAQTFSRPLYGGEFLMGGKGSEERWGEYGHIHIALYSCCFTSCMQGREFDNRAEEKKKKKIKSNSATSPCLSHQQDTRWPPEYILQHRSSGLLQSGVKWNNRVRLLKTDQAAASARQTLQRTSAKTW